MQWKVLPCAVDNKGREQQRKGGGGGSSRKSRFDRKNQSTKVEGVANVLVKQYCSICSCIFHKLRRDRARNICRGSSTLSEPVVGIDAAAADTDVGTDFSVEPEPEPDTPLPNAVDVPVADVASKRGISSGGGRCRSSRVIAICSRT